MIYVKVEDGTVTNRAVFDEPMPTDWPDYEMWHQEEKAQIGWTFDGTTFTAPPLPVSFDTTSIMGGTIRDNIVG